MSAGPALEPDSDGTPPAPLRPRRVPRAHLALRVLLFLTPGPTVVIALFALIHSPVSLSRVTWLAILLGALTTVLALGVFDGLLSRQVPKRNGSPDLAALGSHAMIFLLTQIIYGPVLAFLILLLTFTLLP